MPKLNGVQFITALRENSLNSDTPIYIITGYSKEVYDELKKNRLSHKIVVVEKPISPDMIEKLGREVVALNESEEGNYQLDVNFVNPFIAATKKTLTEMAQLENMTSGKPILVSNEEENIVDISSNLAIISEHFTGMLMIGFPEVTFLNMATVVLDEKQFNINNNNKDLIAEFTNIIFSKTRIAWAEQGFQFEKAIPSVIEGHNHKMNIIKNSPTIFIPFQTNYGPMCSIISIDRKRKI
jgi:chemotaxis protein CheX